jgi:hypothetical protein
MRPGRCLSTVGARIGVVGGDRMVAGNVLLGRDVK